MSTRDIPPMERAYAHLDKDGTLPPLVEWSTDLLMDMYIELSKIREEAKVELKKTQAAFVSLEEDVVRYFQAHAKKKDTRRGRTISIAEETWPKIIDEDLVKTLPRDASKELKDAVKERARHRLIEALVGDPTTVHLVKSAYNSTTLRSWIVNELERDPETLEITIPEHLEGKLGVSEIFRAKVLKSG